MDLTQVFKAAALAKKQLLKAELNAKKQIPSPITKNLYKSQRDEFAKQAREICHKITALRNFLLENRAAYMRIGKHLKGATQMTDEERDLIDRESEKFLLMYTQLLAKMRADWIENRKKLPQQILHMEAVCDLLRQYLSGVQNIFLIQKKQRVQYELDSYRMLKLAPDKKQIPEVHGEFVLTNDDVHNSSSSNNSDEESETDTKFLLHRIKMNSSVQETSHLRHRFKHKKHKIVTDNKDHEDDSNERKSLSPATKQMAVDEDLQRSQQEQPADGLSAEDLQLFEQENDELYEELQGVTHELEAIEKNVVEVAQLQDILTENVSLQNYNIERIANAVIGATENVKDANEQIKQAIQRNAGLRVWSLFFLLVMSFALLFLDWYYE